MTSTIVLPDGRTATVRAFTGNTQKILSDQKRMVDGDGLEAVVRDVAQIGGHFLTTVDARALRIGSRARILLEARRLTYGDRVRDKVRCSECGEDYPVEVDLSRIEDVPFPEGGISFASGGHAFELDWLTVRHEIEHAEGERKRIWGATDTPLLCIRTVDGERIGPKLVLDLPGNVLDAVRRAVRCSIPLHRTEPDRPPVELEAPFDAVPVGGTATRIETWCRHCDERNVVPLEGLMDFLFRGLRSLRD